MKLKRFLANKQITKIILTVSGFYLLLSLLIRLPVYPDEEQWLYINSRQFVDHTMQYLFPVCQLGFEASQPILWLPIRALEWILYSHLGLINHIRIAGIVQAIIFLFVYRTFLKNFARNYKFAKVLAIVTLTTGLIPFLLILNRPEQQLILLFFCALNACLSFTTTKHVRMKILLAVAIAFLVASMPAVHPKGLLFSLATVVFFLFMTRKSGVAFTLPVTAIALISSLNSTQVWSKRTNCKESEFLDSIFRTITLNPTELHMGTIRMVAGNVIRTPKYLLNSLYQYEYQSNWLVQQGRIPLLAIVIANIAFLTVVSFIIIKIFLHFRDLHKRHVKWQVQEWISALFITMFIILTVLQRTKNFYDSYLPIILLGSAGLIVLNQLQPWDEKRRRKVLYSIVIMSIPAFLLTTLNFSISSSKSNEGIYDLIIRDCGITETELLEGGFIIDNSLTKYFWRTPKFVYSGYVWGWWAQDVNAEKLINRLEPPVIIVRNDGTLNLNESDVIVGDFVCRKNLK
jgi:hypothetical protein